MTGIYRNSLVENRKTSFYILAGPDYPVTVVFGAVTGYTRKISPFGGLLLQLDRHKFLVIPKTPLNPLTVSYSVSFS